MIVLGIDTSTLSGSVAVLDNEVVLAEARSAPEHRGADLLVLIDAVCTGAGIVPLDLAAVAVGAGPGSFTGLRIGMATAKGIAFAAKCPLWSVSSLAAIADAELRDSDAGVVAAVLDARRGEVYAGAYRRDAGHTIAIDDERVMTPEALGAWAETLRAAHEGVRFRGDIPLLEAYGPDWSRLPSGAAVARLAMAGDRVDVLVAGGPTYIRKAEAEIRYPDGVPGALRKR